jgi:small subunit ribosomal protein S16
VIHKRSARDGRFIEELGSYDPHGKRPVKLREKEIVDWLGKGAVPSDTVKSILIKAGVWKKKEEVK